MSVIPKNAAIGVVGAGTMGSGIAQVAAMAGHPTLLFDAAPGAAERAVANIARFLDRSVEKGKMSAADRDATIGRLRVCDSFTDMAPAALIVEAALEDLQIKREIFQALESACGKGAIFASNTSSLSITTLGAALKDPGRMVGMHFFNPAPLMPLVEVVRGMATGAAAAETVFETAQAWGKTPVYCGSSPGFIVNRIARPFYGEALRVLEEAAADVATIDALLRECGGFRMGPFELMDLIGVDTNLSVTTSIWRLCHHDARYLPSPIQEEMAAGGSWGRKSGRGFYDYAEGADKPEARAASRERKPSKVVVVGDPGPEAALIDMMAQAGVAVEGQDGGSGFFIVDGHMLALTDGRMAAERAAEPNGAGVIFDYALDFARTPRVCVTAAPGTDPEALPAAVGLFQALGKTVSVIGDTPGMIVMRTVAMIVNEAADAVLRGIADSAGVDTAMRLGVNYPKGPLEWGDTIGPGRIFDVLGNLARAYGDGRYRPSLLLGRTAMSGGRLRG